MSNGWTGTEQQHAGQQGDEADGRLRRPLLIADPLGGVGTHRGAILSQFEFVLVTVAILAGFAISEILAGWGRSLLARDRQASLQLFASLILLFMTVRYLWSLWTLRSIEWQFATFSLVLAPVIIMALAAHVISIPQETDALDSNEVYFARARPFFLLQVATLIAWTSYEWAAASTIRAAFSEQVNFTVFAARAVGVLAFLWLAHTRRPSHHWVVLGGTLAALVYLSLQSLQTLPE